MEEARDEAMTERRVHATRAETLLRVVAWVQRQTTPAPEVPPEVAPEAVALRILKRLALRSLTRWEPSGWLPTRILLTSIEALERIPAS
jgi:hypothetical protein